MAQVGKGLEKKLLEAGNAILSPPPSAKELLSLLDLVETFLTQVEQSPSKLMQKALSPSTKALVSDDLLRHSDVDVKVAVASCVSEITRITAPDAPYEDDQMKEVFQLIVSSFEKLDDMDSPSYQKRISILETVAKVRSCVVMLDLECDSLIIEMFHHFLRSIRENHPENVFSSMETIMTLVLEESEEVSVELLLPILDCLKIQDTEVLPIARKLAEKVLEKCANKVKPNLFLAVTCKGASLNDYSKVVAKVCQMVSETVEASDGNAASKNLADKSDLANAPAEKPVEVAMETLDDAPPSEEVGQTIAGSPKSVMSNGNLQKEIENSSILNDDPEECEANNGVKTAMDLSKPNSETVVTAELANAESKSEKSNKRKGGKVSLKNSPKPSESSFIDNKEAVKGLRKEERESKIGSDHSTDTAVDAAEHTENEKEPHTAVCSPKESENEPADVPLPSSSGILDDNCTKKGLQVKEKDDQVQEKKKGVQVKEKDDQVHETEPASDIDPKNKSDVKKVTEVSSVSKSKSQKRTGKKASSAVNKDKSNYTLVHTSNKEDEDAHKSDEKADKQSGKTVEAVISQREDNKKRGQAKGTPAKDLAKTPSRDDGKKPSTKSVAKSSKDESDVEKTPKAGSKRKQSPQGASETKGYGTELIGKKVKVWWPVDKAYYPGVVDSYDSVKMKHKIVYNDGDEETLKLAKERWELIENDSPSDQEHASDAESPDASAETRKGKKAKTSGIPGSKQGKGETTMKKGGALSSKPKPTPKSGHKQKDEIKADSKPKEDASKSISKSDEDKGIKLKDLKVGNKSSEEATKSAAKSKDPAVAKVANKSKQDTPKDGTKSKGKSPNSNSKSNTNGTGKGKAALSSQEEGDGEEAEESPEPTKAAENTKGKSSTAAKSQKSSKKRKRGRKG